MSQDVTVSETVPEVVPEVEGFSTSQIRAMDALLAGASITKAADDAGVRRETVHRWIRQPRFHDAMEYAKRELWSAAQARLVALAEKAVDVVEKSIADGNTRVALAVLRGQGLLSTRRAAIEREPWSDERDYHHGACGQPHGDLHCW